MTFGFQKDGFQEIVEARFVARPSAAPRGERYGGGLGADLFR